MQKLCPVCQTLNNAVGFDMSEIELHNLHQLGLHEHLCKTCYHMALTNLASATKSELIPLNKKKEETQLAYQEAAKAWKEKADLYRIIDYNISISKFNIQKRETVKVAKIPTSKEPINIEVLAKQILASLNQEQQEAILRTFRQTQTINQQSA